MIRRVRMAALVTSLTVAVPAGVTPGEVTPVPGGRWCVVATDRQSGDLVGSVPLESSSEFALTYRHSYYREPATERLRVDPGGHIVVDRIESPSLAVLDYYELTGATARRIAGGWTIDVPSDDPLDELSVLASVIGRRTLVAGSSTLPLWHHDGRTRAVALSAALRGGTQCG